MPGMGFKIIQKTKVVGGMWNTNVRVLITMGAGDGYMDLLFSLLLYVFENSQNKFSTN